MLVKASRHDPGTPTVEYDREVGRGLEVGGKDKRRPEGEVRLRERAIKGPKQSMLLGQRRVRR